MRDDCKARLLTDATSAQPSDAQIVLWCIRAFKDLIGIVPPVTETTATVSTTAFTATVTADQIFFVATKSNLLLPSEWAKQTTTLHFKPGSVVKGDTVTYWRFNAALGSGPGVITDSSTTVDTSCIFGTDWLEEPATVLTVMQVMSRLAGVSTSGDGPNFMASYRVYQDEREKIIKNLQATWDRWYQSMVMAQNARISVGDLPLRESPGAGLRNESMIVNRLVAV